MIKVIGATTIAMLLLVTLAACEAAKSAGPASSAPTVAKPVGADPMQKAPAPKREELGE
jgi:hypothetical protein